MREKYLSPRFYIILFTANFVTITFIGLCQCRLVANEEARWWQRETLQPSTSQIINPRYVDKKRELEQAWDLRRESLQAESHFRSMGQKTNALRLAAKDVDRQIKQLKHELESIRPYITKRSSNNSPGSQDQTKPIELSIILNNQSTITGESSHIPSSAVSPSQWHDRVIDELLNLLPEDSPKATVRMRYVLMLIPNEYDYTQDRIIVEGVKRVLKYEIEGLFKEIRLPEEKPIKLVIGEDKVVCTKVHYDHYQNYYYYDVDFKIPGTKIIFDDGSISKITANYRDSCYPVGNGYIRSNLIGNNRAEVGIVTRLLQEDPKFRQKAIDDAKKDFEWYKNNYNKSLAKIMAEKDNMVRAGKLIDQLSELSGDCKWIADKSRNFNDMLKILENNERK